MTEDVKDPARRSYASPVRTEQAAATRRRILAAARELFAEHGYAATGVAAIAARAGVAVDTVYSAAGRKPVLLRELVETALSGTDEAVPGELRPYVRRIRETAAAGAKLAVYADAVAHIGVRLAPVHRALVEAASTDPNCAALRAEVDARRARNMRLFVAELRATGELRPELSDDEVADIIWSMNAPEYRALLVDGRGWSAERFGDWLADAWTRSLLVAPAQR